MLPALVLFRPLWTGLARARYISETGYPKPSVRNVIASLAFFMSPSDAITPKINPAFGRQTRSPRRKRLLKPGNGGASGRFPGEIASLHDGPAPLFLTSKPCRKSTGATERPGGKRMPTAASEKQERRTSVLPSLLHQRASRSLQLSSISSRYFSSTSAVNFDLPSFVDSISRSSI